MRHQSLVVGYLLDVCSYSFNGGLHCLGHFWFYVEISSIYELVLFSIFTHFLCGFLNCGRWKLIATIEMIAAVRVCFMCLHDDYTCTYTGSVLCHSTLENKNCTWVSSSWIFFPMYHVSRVHLMCHVVYCQCNQIHRRKNMTHESTCHWSKRCVFAGVTLNHLSWAALLGVPTSGLFLQGKDPSGELIRAEMVRQGVSIEFVRMTLSLCDVGLIKMRPFDSDWNDSHNE